MYIVKLDNDFFSGFGEFYRPDYEIFSPELELKINAVGHFNFTVYPDHSLYEEIDKPKKIISVIRYGEKEPLFIGRVSSVEIGFYNEKIITCESELAFLLDSIGVNFYTDPIQYTAEHWLGEILKRHNTNQDRYGSVYTDNIIRKFAAGKISESLSGKTPVTRKEDYQGAFTTLDIIMKMLVNQYGGVLKLRHEDGKNYIDWIDEDELPLCSQKIELGSNILDMERSVQLDGIVTAIRPVGENVGSGNESTLVTLRAYDAAPYIENSDIKQTINSKASANSILRFYDCLYSESLVEKYGWIQREIKFDGVKEQIALVRKGVKYLLSMGEKSSITITAADLSRANNSIDNFRVGDVAEVNSEIHNINNRKFVVSSLKLDLSDPSKSILTFGSDNESLTSQMGGTVSYNGNVIISDTTNGNISASAALKEAKAYADNGLSEKVDKIQGKGLSTNDFTNNNLTMLNYVYGNFDDKVDKIEGKGLSKNDFTDSYKDKIDGIESGANKTVVDSAISDKSTNPVQNKIVYNHVKSGLNAKVDKVEGKGLSENDYTIAEKNKLAGIESGAQKNTITGIKGNTETSYRTGNVNITLANIGAAAYSHEHYYAESSSIGGAATSAKKLDTSAGSATQPVYFSDGKPVACTHTLAKSVPADAKFTDTNTVYTHPTTAGYKHIPSGGSSGQILRWSSNGTAVWGADNNTTYSAATTSSAGLMSASDKTKLDSIGAGTLLAESASTTGTSATLIVTNDLFKTLPFVYVELYCMNKGNNHMSAVLPLKTLIKTGKTYYISSCGLDSTVYRCDLTCNSSGTITAIFKASTSTTFKITVYKT